MKKVPLNNLKKRRPLGFYLLAACMLMLGVDAIYGGGSLMAEPTGQRLQWSTEMLKHTPFSDFLVPGLLLLFLFGIVPVLLFGAMLFRLDWIWVEALNIFKDKKWVWAYSLYVSIGLIIWIDIQVMMVGYFGLIQTISALYGVLLLVLTLLPGVQRYFEK